VQNNLISIFI